MKNKPKIFKFTSWDYKIKNKVAEFSFRYSFVFDGKTLDLEFMDTIIIFLKNGADLDKTDKDFLNNILNNLHLVLGISYYKLYCPKTIEIENNFLTKEQAKFWNTLYTKGLGEFFYKNKIDFRGLINFPYKNQNKPIPCPFNPENRSFLLFGGGKDSLVSLELLRKMNKKFSAFTLNAVSLQLNLVKIAKVENLNIIHKLDPKLSELNKKKNVYNGHIPVSAIYGFSALLAAVIYGYKYIIFSNERSANYGNVKYLGMEINHQWSKTFEYEKLFCNYAHKFISADLTPFSLLRSFFEVKIVEMFVNFSNKNYFSKFSSCNKNFKISESSRLKEKKWCGKCPKCVFVFALFTAFLPKENVFKIFGGNLYEDKALLPVFKELFGIKKIKPFECVGTPEEIKWAMRKAYFKNFYQNDPIMEYFAKNILPEISEEKNKKLELNFMKFYKENLIPEEFLKLYEVKRISE